MQKQKTTESHNLCVAGGDLSSIVDKNTVRAIMETTDLLGLVLRIHFYFEGFLELWCNKITGCEDFLDIHNISYNMKIEIAKKLNLPKDVATVFKLFNKRRNNFAHDLNYSLSDDELNSIRHAIDRIPGEITPGNSKVADFYLLEKDRSGKTGWDSPNTTVRDKLLLLFSIFHSKLLYIYTVEFTERGIDFNFKKSDYPTG